MADFPNWPDKNTYDLFFTAKFTGTVGSNNYNLGTFRQDGKGELDFAGKFLKRISMIYNTGSSDNAQAVLSTVADGKIFCLTPINSTPEIAVRNGMSFATAKWVWELDEPLEMPSGVNTGFYNLGMWRTQLVIANVAGYGSGHTSTTPVLGGTINYNYQDYHLCIGVLYEFVDPSKRIYVMR